MPQQLENISYDKDHTLGGAATAANVGLGMVKVGEAASEFVDKFAPAIKDVANKASCRTACFMQSELENSFPESSQLIMVTLLH